MRILFLSRWLPEPPDNGSKLRIHGILTHLARRHEVALVSFAGPSDHRGPHALAALRAYCASVDVVPYRPYQPRSRRALAGLFSCTPRFLVDTENAAMRAACERAAGRFAPDLVVASEIDMAPYALTLDGIPLILEDLEIGGYRDAAGRMRSWLTWLKLRAYLQRTLHRFAACTVASERERAHVRSAARGYDRVHVVPNAIALDHYTGDFGRPEPHTLVFSGSVTYGPNLDAVRYFVRDILPRVVAEVPQVTFCITGSTAGVDVTDLQPHPAARFLGHVPDIRPVIAQRWAAVVPLRSGAGTRLKILEAMALGTPVISTSKGAEGLAVTNGEDILLADDPAKFARRVVDVLRSRDLRCRLAAGGRRLVERRYSWQVVGRQLSKIVGSVDPTMGEPAR